MLLYIKDEAVSEVCQAVPRYNKDQWRKWYKPKPPLNTTITLPLFCIPKSDRAKVQSCFKNFIENNINFPKNFILNFGLWEKWSSSLQPRGLKVLFNFGINGSTLGKNARFSPIPPIFCQKRAPCNVNNFQSVPKLAKVADELCPKIPSKVDHFLVKSCVLLHPL